ncbi:ATP-dependent RNA helicase DeaD [Loktanella fryxellensis]|uniref:ATP-dependent RNA helicase DeaD n=1 Tax=Loktanella fryxellensis TaxID=245187 RepID=A0A1H8F7D8_9RHOB|nr:DEAD/DEAH box helicase [Loktanella fryxellensis]SEN27304.1 ATP-dependent RNA helicase DeaD [Loktanella fryxellensis]
MIDTLARALAAKGYDALTPVQEAVTDAALDGQDLLVSAQTGSGKTVGFGLAIGKTILAEDGTFGPAGRPLALIVAPTRELALQVKRELMWLYGGTGAVLASCVGGMDVREERRTLDRGAHIVVATPGRLVDHINRQNIDLSDIRAIVLDEADEMLDLGFKDDLEFILGEAPPERRTLMFSATVPPTIVKLAKSYQKDAVRVATTTKEGQHADIEYRALSVAQHDADNAIINVLRFYDAPNAIVFANTRAMVTRLTTRLSNRGFSVVALSGELSQQERTHALQAMRDGRAKVCVATDVAARGIDLPNLELVIHAELPTNAEILLHRSGRTGRAGRKGISAMIVTPKMRRRAENLLTWGKLQATWAMPPSADEILRKDEERLLGDEIWSATFTEDETAFAARLLAQYDASQIAAAYLRLYQGKQSAPEDLTAYDAPAPREGRETAPKERKAAFGPSKWFRVDVGRDQKAEARWLLPMLCKAGDITKTEIGAIRIQADETFVEIAEGAAAGFLRAVGPEMKLENQAQLSEVDGVPQISDRGARPDKKAYAKRDDDAPREYKPREYKPRDSTPPPPSRQDDVAAIAPQGDTFEKPRKPRADKAKPFAKPERRDHGDAVVDLNKPRPAAPRAKPVWNNKGDDAQPARAPYRADGDAKPAWKGKSEGGDKPAYKGKIGYQGRADAAAGAKPAWKGKSDTAPGAKPAWKGKSEGAGGDKPAWKGKSDGKPAGKPFGKPGGKPAFAKADGAPARPKANPGDTSKRFVPPGAAGKAGPRKPVGKGPLKRGPK